MECDRAREAISARIDGEDPGVPDGALDAHLAGCEACRGWQRRAHVMTRRARLGGPFLEHDLTGQVLAHVPLAPARRRLGLALRAALLAAALGQLAVTVPLLVLGHDQDAGRHAAHELGSFDLALAIAFAVGAIRPALSAGLAWTCGIAAAAWRAPRSRTCIGGQAIGADEAQHLIAVAGAVLLIWQARTAGSRRRRRRRGRRDRLATGGPSSRAAEPELASSSRLAARRRSPGDGAARLGTAPDAARVTHAGGLPDGAEHGRGGPGPASRHRGHGPGETATARKRSRDHGKPGERACRTPTDPSLRHRAGGDGTREIELSVEGMTCAACAARVEKKLGKLDGVRAAVNYATATALVTAPADLPVQALTAAVDAGRAIPPPPARWKRDGADEDGAAGRAAARAGTSPTCAVG